MVRKVEVARKMNTYKYTYKKAKLTLSVDKNLIKLAKDNKINISLFLEEKLKESLLYKDIWTGRDLNPRPPPCEGDDLPLIYQPYGNSEN